MVAVPVEGMAVAVAVAVQVLAVVVRGLHLHAAVGLLPTKLPIKVYE